MFRLSLKTRPTAPVAGVSPAPPDDAARSREIDALDRRSLHLLDQKRRGQIAWLESHLTGLRAQAARGPFAPEVPHAS